MKSITRQTNRAALVELVGEPIPDPINQLMHRRDTAENDLRELMTAVSPDDRRAMMAFYEFHQEEVRLLLAVIEHLVRPCPERG